jgi:type IV pilus assembly protein PilQ
MELGDGMMIKRVPVVMAATCVLLGSGVVASGADTLPVIRDMAAEAEASGAVIHLRATGDLETVHYSPQPGVWVVEMPEASWDDTAAVLSAPELGIDRAELTGVEEFGKRLSRLTVWLDEPARLLLVPVDDGLDLQFAAIGQELPRTAVDRPTRPEVSDELPAIPAVTASPAVPDLRSSASLLDVVPVRAGDGVVIRLKGDRELTAHAFRLENPDRVVVDLANVINRVDRHLYSVNAELVSRVRVAQFQATPVPITRIVVDLDGEVGYELEQTSNGATLSVGASAPATMVMDDGLASARNDSGSISIVPAHTSGQSSSTVAPVSSAMFQVGPATATEVSAVVEEGGDLIADEQVIASRSPFVADPSQLIERAPAAQVLENVQLAEDEFETTEVETEEQQFTGEPITLTLKDADIKDVLRTFSALTQLNIVLDPSVGGSVTVELREVPWDQALDLILRINGLDYVLENNVLRVAPISKLAQEKA